MSKEILCPLAKFYLDLLNGVAESEWLLAAT